MQKLTVCVGLLAATCCLADWTQWRGPSRDGQLPAGTELPATVAEPQLQWRVELADGYSSPVVSKTHVYTVETHDKSHEVVRALDRKTGKEVWRRSWEGAMKVPFFAAKNGSWVRATPALYDGKLYVAGMRDVLVCLDAATGEIVWQVDFTKRYGTPVPTFGFVCSPLVDNSGVYVQAGGSFTKVNRDTGAEIWRSLTDGGGMSDSAFSSPVMAELHGHKQLLVQTRTALAGVDPVSGKALWQQPIKAFRGMNILTPTVYDNAVFTSAYGGGTFLIDLAVDEAGTWTPTVRWRTSLQGYMSSPLIVGDYAFWHLRNQRIACYDLRTGEQKWRSDKSFGKYVSMIAKGDHAIALDQRGTLFRLKLNPEKFELLEEREISDDDAWAHVAIDDKQLFIREQRAIATYRWQ